jgi:hypothetical protein
MSNSDKISGVVFMIILFACGLYCIISPQKALKNTLDFDKASNPFTFLVKHVRRDTKFDEIVLRIIGIFIVILSFVFIYGLIFY